MNGHVTQWISAYHDGELRAARLAQVKEHLSRCVACRAEWEQLRLLSALLQQDSAPALQSSPDRFVSGVLLHLPPTSPKTGWDPALKLAWLAAPLLIFTAWVFAQTALAVGNLAMLAGLMTAISTGHIPALRISGALFGAFLLERMDGILITSPWLGLVAQVFAWIAVSLSLTLFFGTLAWGWIAGWWALKEYSK